MTKTSLNRRSNLDLMEKQRGANLNQSRNLPPKKMMIVSLSRSRNPHLRERQRRVNLNLSCNLHPRT